MYSEEEERNDFVHCRMISPLCHLSSSLIGISWVQPKTTKRCVGGLKKAAKKALGLWSLEANAFDYLVKYLEREK